MTWRLPDWDPDLSHRARRIWVPEAGGWIYQIRDLNNAFTSIFVPDLTTLANTIGHAVVAAERAAQPVAIMPDLAHVRHVKQPIPEA